MRKIIPVLVALAVAAATPALAQSDAPPAGPQAGKGGDFFGHMCADREARAAGRLAYLEKKLQIGPAQKDAWARYVAQTQSAQATTKALCDKFAGKARPDNLPDLLNRMDEIMSAHLTQFKAMKAATIELYAVLSPEQQKIADKALGRPMMGGGGPRPH